MTWYLVSIRYLFIYLSMHWDRFVIGVVELNLVSLIYIFTDVAGLLSG